jgi:hypothetical protein
LYEEELWELTRAKFLSVWCRCCGLYAPALPPQQIIYDIFVHKTLAADMFVGQPCVITAHKKIAVVCSFWVDGGAPPGSELDCTLPAG